MNRWQYMYRSRKEQTRIKVKSTEGYIYSQDYMFNDNNNNGNN